MSHNHTQTMHSAHPEQAQASHAHASHASQFLQKFVISLALTLPIFLYSDMAHMVGLRAPAFFGSQFVLLLIGSGIFFWCGWVFLKGAGDELRALRPGMMTLIALAIIAAYLYSVVSIIFGIGHDLLFELSSLITIMLLGHWLEMKSVQSARGALHELASLLPDTADVVRQGTIATIPLTDVREGDISVARPGAKIPADGIVIEGVSEVNESIVTGESKLVGKK